MDRLIKKALEERAAAAVVPADAWERQQALLLAAGAGESKLARRPWWRRWGTIFEVAAFGILMVGLLGVGITYGPLRRTGGGNHGAHTVSPPSHDDLNLVVNPPTPHVVVAPGLPVLTPPEGSLTQAQIIAAGIAAVNKATAMGGGQLTLSSIALVDGRWALTFRGDGRAFTFSGGPRPSDSRKGVYSHVAPVDQLTYKIIGATGEIYGTGSTGGALATSRTDLEHYRGFIISGGEQTTLRLVRADGGREGRDLVVWMPGQALSESGLDLWHLNYGTGRLIDVWGLTTAPGEVLAYRLAMTDRPGEALLDHDLIHGIPLPDGVKPTTAIFQSVLGYRLEGATVASLKAWYEEQMPRYGWQLGKPRTPSSGNAQVLRFVTGGWQYAEVAILPDAKGAQFTLTWGGTRPVDQDGTVHARGESGDQPAQIP
jgi:hypothetical protein